MKIRSKNGIKPPSVPQKILLYITPELEREGLIGDFGEIYKSLIDKKKRLRAMSWYWLQVLKFLPSFLKSTLQRNSSMFINYLKLAIRNMVRAKTNAFINIFGLAIGLACCLAVMFFIQNENSYDAFHEDVDQKYRIGFDVKNINSTVKFARSSFPLGSAALEAVPEITNAVRFRNADPQIMQNGDVRFYEHNVMFSDPEFFDLFSFPLKQGDPNTALIEPNSVILTTEMAKKYFGKEDVLNQTITLNNNLDLKITGVIQTEGTRSHLQFDFLISFDVFARPREENVKNWGWLGAYTYFKLEENSNITEAEEKIKDLIISLTTPSWNDRINPVLQPLKDIYLYSDRSSEIGINGNPLFSYVLLITACMILLIACFNFINLSTARSVKRSREVGMRKVAGARKGQLVGQFLLESTIFSLLALFTAFLIVESFINISQSFTGDIFANRDYSVLAPVFAGIAVLVGLLSGFYPALILSGFNPVDTFKGRLKSSTGGLLTRKTLVVFQFSISITLIIGTLILSDQMEYVRAKDLGFDKEQVITVRLEQGYFIDRLDTIKGELLKNVNIVSIGASSENFDGNAPSSPMFAEGTDQNSGFRISTMGVRPGFLEALRFELVEGRYFSEEFATDDSLAVIINETTARELGWGSALGKEIRSTLFDWGTVRRVVGVVKDFNFRPLNQEITPLMMYASRPSVENMYIRVRPGDLSEILSSIETDWKRLVPDYPFDYSFLDEKINAIYLREEKFAIAASWTSVLAIFIACLGLVGLVSYTLEQKMKEISIRKVIGATVPGILRLLTKDFLKLVLISNIVAWPVAYYFMSRWLEDFAYRVAIDPAAFLYASLAAVAIAVLTIVFQSLKVVFSNPVNSLRSE